MHSSRCELDARRPRSTSAVERASLPTPWRARSCDAQGERVLLVARDRVFVGQDLGALAERDRPGRRHPRVHHPPPERRVPHLLVRRRERPRRLRQHPRRAVIDSTPPAMMSRPRRRQSTRLASLTASRPDPHSRLTVAPGIDTGRPARSTAIRATLRLSSPAPLASPRYTSSIAGRIERWVTVDQALQRGGGQVVRSHTRQRTAELADRRAHRVEDEGVGHQTLLSGRVPS